MAIRYKKKINRRNVVFINLSVVSPNELNDLIENRDGNHTSAKVSEPNWNQVANFPEKVFIGYTSLPNVYNREK